MGRIFKIVIYAIIIVFLYFWIMTIAKSCGSKNPVDAVVDQAENVVDGVSDIVDDATDEFFDEEGEDFDNENSEESDDDDFDNVDGEDEIDYEELDAEIEDDFDDEPVEESTSTPVRQTTNPGSGGMYMLVAGSYLVNDNATAMKNKLNNMGYDASIVRFDGSSYYTVVAGRYDSNNSAQSASSDLNSRGIDNYVHKKKY